jgi:superfamily II DNA/RNA helicase
MKEREFTVSSMHRDMTRHERQMMMQEFRLGSSRVLITDNSDNLARGVDFRVSLVINFDAPTQKEHYFRRYALKKEFVCRMLV